MRVLLIQGGTNSSRWIWATPDLEVQVGDLSDHRIVALSRGQPLPADKIQETYGFDPLSAAELSQLRREAIGLARIVGFSVSSSLASAAGGSSRTWGIADPASALFGEVVPEEAMADPAKSVTKDKHGLVFVEAVGWLAKERVGDQAIAQWKRTKLCGISRDPRLSGDTIGPDGARRIPFDQAVMAIKEVDIVGNPHTGPRAAREFLMSVHQAGQTVLTHHLDWRSKSGVSDRSVVCRAHKEWSDLLHALMCYDELNVGGLVSGETICRKLIQIETAVRRNPRQPDFEGLDLMMTSVLDESGAAQASSYMSWATGKQRDEAQVLKQGRLLREEREAEARRSKKKGGGGPEAPKDP
eukprot:1027986-Amphidinium_carterae.3